MYGFWKRILSLLLTAAVLLSLNVSSLAAEDGGPAALTAEDYAAADALFARLEQMEEGGAPQSRGSGTAAQAARVLQGSADVVPGSVQVRGESVTWQTVQGISCIYSPRLQAIAETAQPLTGDTGADSTVESYARRDAQHGRDVYLFQPYYGLDLSFTTQYQTEARRTAQATEGTYHYYKGNAATVDAIADAMEDGGVVIFDSHGSTDYENGDDCTTGATTSYLCLQSGEGLTAADYEGNHALYGGAGSSGMKYYMVDGTAIANHMEQTGSYGLVWMAICLGMATDGLEAPLMAKGLGAVYGYSQSVTFAGDYCFEEAFFDSLLGGCTAAEAMADMKERCGQWDCSPQIAEAVGMPESYVASTVAEARQKYCAFPILVSESDNYPGHGKVDDLQTVRSDWNLLKRYELTAVTDAEESVGTVSCRGMTITAAPAEGYYASGCTVTPEGAATVRQEGNLFQVSALRQDCTVTVHFAAKTAAAIRFVIPDGVTQAELAGYVGDELTLPAPSGTPTADGQDYHFVGWSQEAIPTPVESAEFLRPGSSVTVTGPEMTFHAVYQYFATAEGKTPAFTRVTAAPAEGEDWSGTYVITGGDYALLCDGSLTGSELGGSQAAVTLAAAGLQAAEDGALTGVSGAYSVQILRIPNSEQYSIRLGGSVTPVYLACRANNDQLNTAADAGSSLSRWSITWENGAVKIANVRYPARSLQFCAGNGYFRCVTRQETALTLYHGEDSGLWYTTALAADHEHQYAESARQAATCTQEGWVEYTCVLCQASYRETLSVLGHSFTGKASGEMVKAADCTHPAEYAVQCDRCEAVDGSRTVPVGQALGHTYENGQCIRCGAQEPSGGGTGGGSTGGGSTGGGSTGGGSGGASVPAEVTLTFAVNGGSAIEPLTVESGAEVDLADYRPVRAGYLFAGWYQDAALTKPAAVLTLTEDATVYAKWTAIAFRDVDSDAYYAQAVAWAVEKGITAGKTAELFDPDAVCTRGQAVTFLWRLAGSPQAAGKNPFADVAADSPYYEAILWAAEQGITKGISETAFAPDATVTRAQAAAFLWRYAGESAPTIANPFRDVGGVLAEAVLWAAETGVTRGRTADTFAPGEGCTRAQLVTFLYRSAAGK